MIELLTFGLRVAGVGLILLALVHVPISRQLRWAEDSARLTPVNGSIFRVHAFFICLVLVLMGLPCLLDPGVLLERSRAGAWIAWSCAVFWGARLWCQWLVYPANLWRGKRLETGLHWLFTFLWSGLTALFMACALRQVGWWNP